MLFERLEVVEAMRAFVSHRLGGGEELRARLERVETDLATAQKVAIEEAEALKFVEGEREVIHAEADKLKKEGEIVEAKLKGAE